MNGIERPKRLPRERLAHTLDDFGADAQNVPVSCSGCQVRAPIRRFGLCQLVESGSSMENPIAFNEREIGR